MADSEQPQHQHTEALRALCDLLHAMQSERDDDDIRQKSERVKSLLASYIEQFGQADEQTQAGALEQLVQKFERVRAVEDNAAALLRALLQQE